MIQKNWQELIKPGRPEISPGSNPTCEARIVVEPLERGYGLTLGNALRRILLSSLQGAAVTAVQIEGVLHEFSTIAGVREDVVDIILNVKDMDLACYAEGPRRMSLSKTGPGPALAGDIEVPAEIKILNPELVLCTLDKGASVNIEFTVNTGKGYVPAARNKSRGAPIGTIPVDSLYSPVRQVSYRVEKTREGRVLDYDRLILNVSTSGMITPEDAVAYAARILQEQLQVFISFEEPPEKVRDSRETELGFDVSLLKKVDELELSVRPANCLKNEKIRYIGDLVQKEGKDLMRMPNFGRKSLDEIEKVLQEMSLSLGMNVPNWPPENVEQLARRYEEHY